MGYACHLLSNNHPDLPLVLDRMGLTGEFEKQFIGSLYGYDKPCMELYRYAMESTGVREDSEVWMIGDNLHLDSKPQRKWDCTPFGWDTGMHRMWDSGMRM